jgi:hypothetical protein
MALWPRPLPRPGCRGSVLSARGAQSRRLVAARTPLPQRGDFGDRSVASPSEGGAALVPDAPMRERDGLVLHMLESPIAEDLHAPVAGC